MRKMEKHTRRFVRSFEIMARSVLRIISAIVFIKSLFVFFELPDDANVPVKYGFQGEIVASVSSKYAFLLYPIFTFCFGCFPVFPLISQLKTQDAGKDTDLMMGLTVGFVYLMLLNANLLFMAIVFLSPNPSDGSFGSLPLWIVPGFLSFDAGVCAMYAWWYALLRPRS